MKKPPCMNLDHSQFHKSHKILFFFFLNTSFTTDSNWVRFAPKLLGKQDPHLWGGGVWRSPPDQFKLYKHTCTHFEFRFIRISISSHQSDHASCCSSDTQGGSGGIQIYIRPHFQTNSSLFIKGAIAQSNYRKTLPLNESPAGRRGKHSLWAGNACVWTAESSSRDVNHCLSLDHLPWTTHHPLLQRAVLKDKGKEGNNRQGKSV